MSDLIYPLNKQAMLGDATYGGPIDWDADPIFMMLVNSTYVGTALATLKTHRWRSDVTSNEVSGTGYTAGGIQLASIAYLTATDARSVDCNDVSWAASTITAAGAVIFKRVGADMTTPGDDPILLLLDFSGNKSSSGGSFTVVINASGLFQLT